MAWRQCHHPTTTNGTTMINGRVTSSIQREPISERHTPNPSASTWPTLDERSKSTAVAQTSTTARK